VSWIALPSDPLTVTIVGGVVVLFLGWLGRSLFKGATGQASGAVVTQTASPVMTQNFNPTISVGAPGPAQVSSRGESGTRIHEKEFEVLPKAWQLLNEAHGAAYQVTRAFRQWPNLDGMPDKQLEAVLDATPLAEFQKNEIKGCGNKLNRYQEVIFWYELDDAKRAQIALNNYLAVNSIFMTEALRRQFSEINKLLIDVIHYEQTTRQYPYSAADSASARREQIEEAKSERAKMTRISEMLNGIEAEIQRRLRRDEA